MTETPTPGPAARYLRDWIFGAIDGGVTTFAVVAGVAGAGLGSGIIIVLGLANLLADGFSMAAGNFAGTRAERQLAAKNDASTHERPPGAMLAATATFTAFVLVGAIPLAPYLLALALPLEPSFTQSAVATAIAFALVGLAKGAVIGEARWLALAETVGIGCLAAAVAYAVGRALRGLVDTAA